jgi:hypothetical protein
MTKQLSRPKRWAAAVAEGQRAIHDLEAAKDRLNDALSNLRDLQEEYSEWLGNMPENLQSSGLGEKLQAISDLDLEDYELEGAEDKISEAEGVDLPQGFGRD